MACCFRLEATRGPHTGSTHFYCSISRLSSSPDQLLSIGRKKCCWLRLPKDLEVSSVHAEFRFVKTEENETRLGLCDVKSTNGTKINGKMIKTQQDYLLSDGDLIAVGRTSLRFVQVGHGQPCREEGVDSAATSSGNTILTPSTFSSSVIQSAAAPMVIELDDEETGVRVLSSITLAFAGTSGAVSTVIGSSDMPAEPDIEPDHGGLKLVKNVVVIERDMGNSRKEGGDNVELKVTAKSGRNNAGVVDEYTLEEATCTACSTVIGQLDMLEQQVHLNESIGGRVTITTANAAVPFTASTVLNDAKSKTRNWGKGGSEATRTKKPRKPKACDNNDSTAAALKTKRPRKRKRIDTGGDMVLALALTGTSKIDKEQQTDLHLAGTKKKIEELDKQMAKLAKRRVNLVKTLSRLEKTKEKLRKSQVLPPAKVLQLLDLKAALGVIFPNNRQVHSWDQRVYTKRTMRSSVVATRYTPLRWSERSKNVDCDETKHTELVAVAAISMWKRASQQLFGLQRDSLLYRNSVLRAFLGSDEDAECGSIDIDASVDMENDHNVDIEGTDVNFEREAEYEGKFELAPVLSDYTLDWTRTYSEFRTS
ncbi:unnamed protein product [Peronospora destructor]|uniref:FHA domain-containing protein n=3 Tax=Peronospora destructor TaxID=86335 RepID=A0AAV0V7J9_9STRA|nr:unnamed protein product [Peronospora destructor]